MEIEIYIFKLLWFDSNSDNDLVFNWESDNEEFNNRFSTIMADQRKNLI